MKKLGKDFSFKDIDININKDISFNEKSNFSFKETELDWEPVIKLRKIKKNKKDKIDWEPVIKLHKCEYGESPKPLKHKSKIIHTKHSIKQKCNKK